MNDGCELIVLIIGGNYHRPLKMDIYLVGQKASIP